MGNNCVLIVNDSKFESMILKDILIKLGLNPSMSNEYTVMKDFRRTKPFMVIVNYIMESTTGDKIIEEIKKKFPKTKCILSSSNECTKEKFSNANIDMIIKTPITLEQMRETINPYVQIEGLCSKCKKEIKEEFYICPYCGENLKVRA